MNLTHYVTRNWGLDIIVLTILVRLALYPLNRSMNTSMKLMQKAQPELKEVQEKYKDKPEELQKRTMEVWKKYKINPLASCLPMLIQMPIFFALFRLLRDSRWYLRLPGFENASLLGINLTMPPHLTFPHPEMALKAGVLDLHSLIANPWFSDRFLYIYSIPLVIAYIITMLLQQKMMQSTTQTAQPGQPNTMALMMPMIIFFGIFFPSGLLAYFTTSNLLQIGTYWRIKREVELEEGTEKVESPSGTTVSGPSNKRALFSLDKLFGRPEKAAESADEPRVSSDIKELKETTQPNTGTSRKGKKKKKK